MAIHLLIEKPSETDFIMDIFGSRKAPECIGYMMVINRFLGKLNRKRFYREYSVYFRCKRGFLAVNRFPREYQVREVTTRLSTVHYGNLNE